MESPVEKMNSSPVKLPRGSLTLSKNKISLKKGGPVRANHIIKKSLIKLKEQ